METQSPSENEKVAELAAEADRYALKVVLDAEKEIRINIHNVYEVRQLIIQLIGTAWAKGYLEGTINSAKGIVEALKK